MGDHIVLYWWDDLQMRMLSETEREGSFTEFFTGAERRLRGAFTATFGSDLGPEICADAFAYGWEHWDRLSSMANPAGYLYKVGLRRGRRLKRDFALTVEPMAFDSPRWFEPGLVRALATLSERQRLVVGLIHGYGWSLAEVARLLEIAKSSVQSYEERGMRRLRRKLGVTT